MEGGKEERKKDCWAETWGHGLAPGQILSATIIGIIPFSDCFFQHHQAHRG